MNLCVKLLWRLLLWNIFSSFGHCYISVGVKTDGISAVTDSSSNTSRLANPAISPQQCHDFWTCFALRMLKNISDISEKDSFNLTSNLLFSRIYTDTEINNVKSFNHHLHEAELLENTANDYDRLTSVLVNDAAKIFETHSLTWKVLPGVNVKVFRSRSHKDLWDAAVEVQEKKEGSRTFGARRRIMMALLPMMYKMGIMTTMLGGLIVLALKGLTIGIILLILGFGNFFYKFKNQGGPWYPPHPTDIHVHLHNDGHKQAYSGWHYGPSAPDHSDIYSQ